MTGSWFKTGKANTEWYDKEKARVKNILNDKYANDEVFREKAKARAKNAYLVKKQAKEEEQKLKNDISIMCV